MKPKCISIFQEILSINIFSTVIAKIHSRLQRGRPVCLKHAYVGRGSRKANLNFYVLLEIFLVMKGLIIAYKSKRLKITQMILSGKIMKNPDYEACFVLYFLGVIMVLI